MDSNNMDLLDQVREKIVESVDILDILIDLRKYNILDHKDQENVCQVSNLTKQKKYQVLFKLIKSRGDRAFWAFCHSLENKAPIIYRNLHDNSNVNARDNCAICSEESGDFKCQYCLGSINVIEDSLITKPSQVADKILDYKTRFRELMDKYESLEKNLSIVSSNYRKSREKHQEDLTNERKTNEIKEKELRKYLSEIEELKHKVDVYKERNEYFAKRLTNAELTNSQQAEELEKVSAERLDERFYANERDVYRMKEKENVKLIQSLEDKNRKLQEDKIKLENHLNMSEELLNRTKSEYDSKLSYLNKSLKSAVKDSEELKKELSYYEKKIEEKKEIIQNKQKQIMDQEFELQIANKSISTLKSQVQVQEILSKPDNAKEIQKLYDSNTKLAEEKDDLEIKLKNAEKNYTESNDKYARQIQEYKDRASQLQEENEVLLNSGGNISSLRKEADIDLHLKRIDGKFGIVYTHYKSLALLHESNILVKSVTSSNVVNTDADHRLLKGAFVIVIQGKDVTNYNTKMLQELMEIQRETCHLLIRPRNEPKYEILSLNLDNQTNGALDKTTFHVFMRIKESSPAVNCGFRDFDEILEFGKEGKIQARLSKIRKSIEAGLKKDKSCAFKIKRITNPCTVGRERFFSQSSTEANVSSRKISSVSDISKLPNQIKGKETNSETSSTSSKESPASPTETERSMSPPPVPPRDIKKIKRSDSSTTICTNSTNSTQEVHTTDEHGYEIVCTRTAPGTISEEEVKHIYENNEVRVDLQKKTDEGFGFNIIGGNKYGIFVDAVERWTPAEKARIPKFQKLLKIEKDSLENATLSFAVEALNKYMKCEKISFIFKTQTDKEFLECIKKDHTDGFRIRSEIEYKGITKDELSFKKGDVLYVVNSCAIKQYTTKWKARILGADGEVEEGLIPKLSTKKEVDSRTEFREINEPIYKILEDVKVTLDQNLGSC